MIKSALGCSFSLLLVFFSAPAALAEEAAVVSAAPAVVAPQAESTSAPKSEPTSENKSAAREVAVKSHVASRRKARVTLAMNANSAKKIIVAHSRRKATYQQARASFIPTSSVTSAGDLAGLNLTRDSLALKSNVAFVMDQENSQVLFDKNSNVALPIASITKLMTGLIVVEAHQDMSEILQVTDDDVDREKFSSSRLRVGAKLSRANMLHIALMSSENRAASALGRNYPGGLPAFVAAMNAKAAELGMTDTHYVDSSGLSSRNVASARDLAKLVVVAHQQPLLCQYSTDPKYVVATGGRPLQYANTDRLVKSPDWDIGLQKTGFINEAGHCLVMLAKIEGRNIVMIFLDSKGKLSHVADAGRIRKWVTSLKLQPIVHEVIAQQS